GDGRDPRPPARRRLHRQGRRGAAPAASRRDRAADVLGEQVDGDARPAARARWRATGDRALVAAIASNVVAVTVRGPRDVWRPTTLSAFSAMRGACGPTTRARSAADRRLTTWSRRAYTGGEWVSAAGAVRAAWRAWCRSDRRCACSAA